MHASTQLPVRVALFVLAAFVTVASTFGFEGILGAFAAGMIVGLATRGEEGETFRAKVDAVCFGFLTPFFFVGTGLEFDPSALTRGTATMLLTPGFLFLFLMIRGAPLVLFRDDLPKPERLAFALSASVASLALVVVITDIGLLTKYMNSNVAEGLIAASLLSLLLYPTLAGILLSRNTPSANSFRAITTE